VSVCDGLSAGSRGFFAGRAGRSGGNAPGPGRPRGRRCRRRRRPLRAPCGGHPRLPTGGLPLPRNGQHGRCGVCGPSHGSPPPAPGGRVTSDRRVGRVLWDALPPRHSRAVAPAAPQPFCRAVRCASGHRVPILELLVRRSGAVRKCPMRGFSWRVHHYLMRHLHSHGDALVAPGALARAKDC
jgi:hypothetical protein